MKISVRKRSLKEIRKEQLVPGVIYGKSIQSTPVEAELNEVLETLKNYGKNMTFAVTLNRKKHQVYFKNIQSLVLKPKEIIHFELHALAKDETIMAQIPVTLIGQEALEKQRYFVQFNTPNIDCEYSPGGGISHFEFDVSKMRVNDSIHVKDLIIPEGVTIKNDPDLLILSIKEGVQITDDIKEVQPESETNEVLMNVKEKQVES